MPDSDVSGMPAITALNGDEYFHVIEDPTGTSVDSRIAANNLLRSPYGALSSALAVPLMFPGLVGFWPGWILGQGVTGNLHITDLSEHGLNLTRNGGALQAGAAGVSNAFGQEIFFNGTTGYLSLADSDIISITGTETGIAATMRGLTLGMWIRFDNDVPAANEDIFSKWDAGSNQRAYLCRRATNGDLSFFISSNGTALFESSIDETIVPHNTWLHIVFIFTAATPSTRIMLNGASVFFDDTSPPPSSIFDSTAPFHIGADNAGTGNFLDGHMSMPFLCAAAVPQALVTAHYELTAPLFS